MVDKVKDILSKIPMTLIIAIIVAYLGYDYYQFAYDQASPLMQKQGQVESLKKEGTEVQDKIRRSKEFFASLDKRRLELRGLAVQLSDLRVSLSEQVDISSFIKTVVNEAAKVGVSVEGIKPTESKESEFYTEQAFDLSFTGVYVQLVVLLDHLANSDKIIRVDQFSMKASPTTNAQYVELEGTLQLKSYRYKGTKADDLGKVAVGNPTAVPAPTKKDSPVTPAQPGGHT